MRSLRRSKRYKINGTNHLREQIDKRFRWLNITDSWVVSSVRKTLNRQTLQPRGLYWVRLMQFSREIRLEADTRDGAVNGDTLYAVVRWSEINNNGFSITTVLLRREGQTTQCDALYDAVNFRLVNI